MEPTQTISFKMMNGKSLKNLPSSALKTSSLIFKKIQTNPTQSMAKKEVLAQKSQNKALKTSSSIHLKDLKRLSLNLDVDSKLL